jgi:hypothetical protein
VCVEHVLVQFVLMNSEWFGLSSRFLFHRNGELSKLYVQYP